ncbi:MAG: FHA domain-containing protein [Chloroflexi bacterium]|nr:FHA domain-containing protein [Chloroflexota bacterium]
MKKLEKLESQLRSLIEDHLLKALPGSKLEAQIAQQLAAAIKTQPDGSALAPNMYVIVAHPSSLTQWRGEPGLLDELLTALIAAGGEAGLQFSSTPTLTTAADTSMKPGEARVLASFSAESLAETQGMPAEASEEAADRVGAALSSSKGAAHEIIPGNAFLIVQGTRIFPLTRSVINIGRRLDNHVVIDDPRISRNHAQLRAVKGRYILFDLNSTGGTYVNNQRMNQSILYPGDVISLAGVMLIFGQDVPLRRAETGDEETASSSAISELPTIFFPPGRPSAIRG